MADERLSDFYETKYADEATSDVAETHPLVKFPANRFEGAVATLAPRVVGKDVLELASGVGSLPQSLLAHDVAFNRWILTDLASNRIEGTRKRLAGDPRLSFRVADAAEPSQAFGGERFDVIVSVALIEHLIDPITAMADTRKLLKPGGFVYIDTPNVAKWTRRVKLLLGQFPSTASSQEGLITYDGQPVALHDEGHIHYFSFRSLERMLVERCGYSRVERVPYALSSKPLRAWWALAQARPTLFSELAVMAYA